MRVTYVLPYPELNGGNKVIFQHARLLQELGHELTILAEGGKPDWIRIRSVGVSMRACAKTTYVRCRRTRAAIFEADRTAVNIW